jgi:uncharacterized protein (DUF2252 family)
MKPRTSTISRPHRLTARNGPTSAKAALPAQTASVKERQAAGHALAKKTPLKEHGIWRHALRRHDPIDLLIEESKGRTKSLLPIRYGRMVANPFAFLRGSAGVMAADLSLTESTGVHVQACGDCHLANFGGFATPERRVIFDINDFDESSLAPWEWDVKRLAASFVSGLRINPLFDAEDARECARRAARSYRRWMARYAEMPILEAWYDSIAVDDMIEEFESVGAAKKWKKKLAQTSEVSAHQIEFGKLAVHAGRTTRIVDQPPLIFHVDDTREPKFRENVQKGFLRYKESLQHSVRQLLNRFEVVDVARKVVGVGSVGTACAIVLLESGNGDPLFLQVKEAGASVLERYCGAAPYKHHGERVVRAQRLMQSASDMFLGWLTGPAEDGSRNYYLRQLNDVKLKPEVELAVPHTAKLYARYCGRVLARAHCRSGDAVLLSAYMGDSDAFEEAIADFGVAYADQTERDHQALLAAVRAGRVEAQMGM